MLKNKTVSELRAELQKQLSLSEIDGCDDAGYQAAFHLLDACGDGGISESYFLGIKYVLDNLKEEEVGCAT